MQTPSSSATQTGTVTPGLPPSQSMTQTPRPPAPSDTPSQSVSGSITPSNSPSPSQIPNCFTGTATYQFIGRGVSGSSGLIALNSSSPNVFSGSCTGYSVSANFQSRVAIDLGPNTELGYPLEINLCTGTTFDSTL